MPHNPLITLTDTPKIQDVSQLHNKRVLFVINANGRGGVEHLALTLQKDLILQDAHIQNLYLYNGTQDSKRAKIRSILKVIKDIIAFKADILITFQPTSSVIATFITRLTGCKTRIVHESNLPSLTHVLPRYLDRLLGRSGFYSVNIMNSKATELAFKDYPKTYRSKLHYIPHGIVWSAPQKERSAIRKEMDIEQERPVFLTCARLSKEKSLETIIEAMPSIPEALFIIAGEGTHQTNLQNLAKDLGVTEQVRFIGHVSHDQLSELHLASDLFVFPSRSETFGMAAVEAAMSGLPIVSSNLPVIKEVLTIEGQSAVIFVPDWSPENWVLALHTALKDQSLAQKAKALAPKLRKTYNITSMLERYRALYKDLLS